MFISGDMLTIDWLPSLQGPVNLYYMWLCVSVYSTIGDKVLNRQQLTIQYCRY